ncbi:hypothetical protein HDG37_004146 [Paraburkholderia sp. MM5384-R2]|nr:hypothetical protein [Paraburkholderia sp. MM5384-R2]
MRTCTRTSKLKVREFGSRPDGATNCEWFPLKLISHSQRCFILVRFVDAMKNVVAVRGAEERADRMNVARASRQR